MDTTEKESFDHTKAGIMDRLWVLAELEHLRRHAIRSAVSLYNDDDKDNARWLDYAVAATRSQELRREYQKEAFGNISEYDWCLVKVAMSLKQLVYETVHSDYKLAKELDDLTDSILEKALGVDSSNCSACKDDAAVVE